MRFLIIRFSSIGDIVLTTPVIRCLKNQMPGAEVHYLTKKSFAGILEANPYIYKIHLLEKDLKGLVSTLKKEKFDYVIDLHHNLRTARVKWGLGVKSYSFNKLNIEKWLMTALKINRLPEVHIVDRYLETLRSFGIKNDGQGLDYFIPTGAGLPASTLPETHRNGYVGLVVGAALATKQLPLTKLDELCGQITAPIVLLGGPEDAATGIFLSGKHRHTFNGCGPFTLHQSADLVRQARAIITHDTGLMHIAAAFRVPILSIWGNTIPAFGLGPYYPQQANIPGQAFEVSGLKCRPCSKIGFKACPKGHFNCMMKQDLVAIAARIEAIWAA